VTLVDTSVWIDYFRGARGSRGLAELLEAAEVIVHPFVRGEITLGHLGRRRAQILRDLTLLPRATLVPDDDVLQMVQAHRLAGSGIGWVDAHLLASALDAGAALWTLDGRLSRVVSRLRIAG
jgi:predicted nucleic acid-binding protein